MSVLADSELKKQQETWNNGLRNEGVYAVKVLVFAKRAEFT